MLRNTSVQAAAVLAVGVVLGYLAASGGPSPLATACAEQSLAPAGPSSGAKPACCDQLNRGQLLALGNRSARKARAALRAGTQAARDQAPTAGPADRPPRNIIFVICDQETYHLTARDDYKLPARRALMRHGVTFRNHYIASAMCTPSRAAFLTGQPPQVNGVFDQMEYSYQPSLSPDRPNMGSVLKGLGYQTAYLGKFEMDKPLLGDRPTVNYSTAAKPYGFDLFAATGDTPSGPHDGYTRDGYIAGQGVRWLRTNVPRSRQSGKPFFLVLSFLNPHDIMFANANVPGLAPVQKPAVPLFMPPLPANLLYERQWAFSLAPSLAESLTGKGMPAALAEYHKGWSGALGLVPIVDRASTGKDHSMKTRRVFLLAVPAVLLGLTALVGTAKLADDEHKDDNEAIARNGEAFVAAFDKGDARALAAPAEEGVRGPR
jgi:hypothetical protein